MSRSMHICCLDCKEHLWIGQNDTLYTGEQHTMEALRQFLIKHRTHTERNLCEKGEYHELIYHPEPYNGGLEELRDEEWTEWDAEEFKKPMEVEKDKTP